MSRNTNPDVKSAKLYFSSTFSSNGNNVGVKRRDRVAKTSGRWQHLVPVGQLRVQASVGRSGGS